MWLRARWGRSVTDLLTTLQELEHLGVGFVSLTEALICTIRISVELLQIPSDAKQ
jgi:DNA invertase Pin-like site-specific DNA recombinase